MEASGQSTARRHIPGEPCAVGCGQLAAPGRIYCAGCVAAPRPPSEGCAEPDVQVLTLSERLAGGGPLTRRLAKYGPSVCGVCGGDSMPGRLYCSGKCRSRARRPGAGEVELDGVTATPLAHADRLGLGRSTLYRRLQLGLSVQEALTRPVNQEMRGRFHG